MKKRLVYILGVIFIMVAEFQSMQANEISDTVDQIRSSQAYDQVRQIFHRNIPLLLAAADDALAVKKHVTHFRRHPLRSTKNIIQHGARLFKKKKKLDLLVSQLVNAINSLTEQESFERVSTYHALCNLSRALARISEHFKELGRFRKVHRIGKNVSIILELLQHCKAITHSDEALFLVADEFHLEKEITQLNEDLKQIKRKHGIVDQPVRRLK